MNTGPLPHGDVTIRPMMEDDIVPARRIHQLAFGTFEGAADPATYRDDVDSIGPRWHTDPSAAWVAEAGGRVIGSNLATNWGSVGSVGPLTVHPAYWDRGIGQKLLARALARFEEMGTGHVGLFTYAGSPKHVELYRRQGFWPRFLTAIMSVPVVSGAGESGPQTYGSLSDQERREVLHEAFNLTRSIWPGLDLRREIEEVHDQQLGDTVLLRENGDLSGFAVCHCGRDTEAGEANCFIRFGAVRSRLNASAEFDRLLDACEGFAGARGQSVLIAGTNMARVETCEILTARGFRTDIQGVMMSRGNRAGYNRPGVYIIDDLR